MQTPQNFIGCPGVLNIGMFVVVILYTAVGFFGYLKYGDATKGSITLNLPTEEVYVDLTFCPFSHQFQLFLPLQSCPVGQIYDSDRHLPHLCTSVLRSNEHYLGQHTRSVLRKK